MMCLDVQFVKNISLNRWKKRGMIKIINGIYI